MIVFVGATHQDKPIDNYPFLQFPGALYDVFAHCIVFTAHNSRKESIDHYLHSSKQQS